MPEFKRPGPSDAKVSTCDNLGQSAGCVKSVLLLFDPSCPRFLTRFTLSVPFCGGAARARRPPVADFSGFGPDLHSHRAPGAA